MMDSILSINKSDVFSNIHSEGIFIYDKEKIVDVNPIMSNIFGFSREELIGKEITHLVPLQSKELFIKKINSTEHSFDIKGLTRQGETLFLEILPKKVSKDKKVLKMALVRDISVRKKSENILKQKNISLKALINNLPGIVYQCQMDKNWTMLNISPQCTEITGYTPEDFLRNKNIAFADIIHPQDLTYVEDIITSSISSKESYQLEYRIITKQGDEKWVREKGVGIFKKGVLRVLEGFIIDITAEKRNLLALETFNEQLEKQVAIKTASLIEANEELTQQSEELKSNSAYIEEINQALNEKNIEIRNQNIKLEHHLSKTQELNNTLTAIQKAINAAAIVSITDLKGVILEVNKKFCTTSQYSEKELKGQNQNIVSSHTHTKEFWQNMWKTIARGKVWRGEIMNKKKDGSYYWTDTVIAPIQDKNGKNYQYIAIRFLITKRKNVEAELKEKNDSITQSIKYAKNIQNAILPRELDIKKNFKDSFILYKPKDIVSGDFIWYWYDANNKTSYLAAVDCTGHGVPGAFMSMLGYELLDHIIINRGIHRPDIILEEKDKAVRRLLKQDNDEIEGTNDGMDMSLIAFDHESKALRFSGANNGLYIIRKNELIELKPNRVSIGSNILGREKEFTMEKVLLQENDFLCLFTDGYHDQLGGDLQKKFMKFRLKKLLELHSDSSLHNIKNILINEHHNWKGDFFQVDDITIIGIRI